MMEKYCGLKGGCLVCDRLFCGGHKKKEEELKMRFDIRREKGHYVLEIDGKFYGSYDTFSEALMDLEGEMEAHRTRDLSGVAV